MEVKSECLKKTLRIDDVREFILIKLWQFCKKRGIAIKYTTPYVHKENNITEKRWHIFVTIKNSLLIDSRLLNHFKAKVMETANYLRNRLPMKTKTYEEMISKKA